MLNRFKKNEPDNIDEMIDNIVREMENLSPDTEEYAKMMTSLERLYELKKNKKQQVSPDTMAIVIGNLAGIVLILTHERLHVITTKAYQLVVRPKTQNMAN